MTFPFLSRLVEGSLGSISRLVRTLGDGESCVTPARAAAKETRDRCAEAWHLGREDSETSEEN